PGAQEVRSSIQGLDDMTQHTDAAHSRSSGLPHSPPSDRPTSAAAMAAHVIMFWVLTGMALAVFAPCVLVPIWQELEGVRAYRDEMRAAIQSLQAQVRKNQERINGLREDPLANERIARRELNYRPEAEQIVRVSSQELATLRVQPPPPLPGELDGAETAVSTSQHWTQWLTHWLPPWPYQ